MASRELTDRNEEHASFGNNAENSFGDNAENEIVGAIGRVQSALTNMQAVLRHPAVSVTLNDDLEKRRRGAIRTIIHVREIRERHLGQGLFADPAWNILLDAYASDLDGRNISISDACLASGVPSSTALRWLRVLEEKGLIERHSDTTDRRRAFIALTLGARETVEALIDQTIMLLSGQRQPD